MGSDTAAGVTPGVLGHRILDLADHLAQWSESPDNLTCTYLTPAHRAVASRLRTWMQAAGMSARIDPVGNVIGRFEAEDRGAKTLLIGSHYDTVRNAGKYDGRLGILTVLAIVEHLSKTGRRLPFHLELYGFAEEEGVRFGTSYMGSSAVAGRFDMKMLERRDAGGQTVADVLRSTGSDPAEIPKLGREMRNLIGYLEVHIEQGPVLQAENLPVGIVTAIAGGARFLVTVTGLSGHAGTVPMTARRDAAAAAAEIVLYVEKRCGQSAGLVGTVGQINVPNGATNVIPGRCDLSIDIRGDEGAKRDAAIADVFTEFERLRRRRGVVIEAVEIQRTPVVRCSDGLQEKLAASIDRAGIRPLRLLSGAGHDGVMFDGLTEVGMLFVRCGNGGVSHSPMETITASDADVAARVLLDTLEHLG